MWAKPIPAGYWWTGKPNFGDMLTPLLMQRVADLPVGWAPPAFAQCTVVGSILHHLPADWSGYVAGTGLLYPEPVDLPRARALGVRGPLTRRLFRQAGSHVTLGDPGLLASHLIEPVDPVHNLGLLPHWSDDTLGHRPEFARWNPHIIRPTDPPLHVIRQIAACKKLVTSSLHGVIVADAFGIPRRVEIAPRFAREGGDFKFRDHAAVVRVPFEVGRTQEADRFVVSNVQAALFDMLEDLGRRLTGKTRDA